MVLQYKEFGDSSSPLMVFIHGGGVSGWMWDKQIKHFTNFPALFLIYLSKEKTEVKIISQ